LYTVTFLSTLFLTLTRDYVKDSRICMKLGKLFEKIHELQNFGIMGWVGAV
jgi:hypothetical protein